jgi:hypothetical protein
VHGGILLKKLVTILLIAFLCFSNVFAAEETSNYNVQINVASRTLRLFSGGSIVKEYPIAVGKPSTKTPLGNFEIKNKFVNPYWKGVAPGPNNPLGIRWMGISIRGGSYGIHGNNTPTSISTFASGGCIRMYNNDVEELYSIIGVKTPVQIIYEDIEIKHDMYTDAPVVIIYPDAYKKKDAESLMKKLIASNKNITEKQAFKVLEIAAKGVSNPIAVGDSTAIMLNNQFITNNAFVENNEVYIYYLAALDILGIDNSLITDYTIPVLEKDSKIYVNLTQVVSKTGGQLRLDKANNNVYLSNNIIKINGKFLSSYTGGFDKENLIKSSLINKLGTSALANGKELVNLKELCKQQNWGLKASSISKIMDIEIPMRVKVGEVYINTELYKGRYYINSEEAENIPSIQNQNLNIYRYKSKSYYDVYEIMDLYECQKDDFSTTVEVFKPLHSEV